MRPNSKQAFGIGLLPNRPFGMKRFKAKTYAGCATFDTTAGANTEHLPPIRNGMPSAGLRCLHVWLWAKHTCTHVHDKRDGQH